MRVVVHIDELDLHAVAPPRRAEVADAFVRELTALIGARRHSWRTENLADAPDAHMRVDLRAPPHEVGMALARTVYASLVPALGGER